MKRYLLLLTFLIHGLSAYTQTTITGVVTDAGTNMPVQYVSIGITTVPDGTISNVDGAFSITLDNKVTNNDTLKFSSIGYQSKTFLIWEVKKRLKDGPLKISLTRAVIQLKSIAIVAKKAHVKIEGYDKNSKLFGLGFGASGVGSQGGVIIPISHQETNLQNVSFYIIKNPFKHLTFRVNFYEMDNGKPGNSILSENILIHVDDNKTGKLIFDLSKYNIYANHDVLLSLEWIEAQPSTDARLAIAAAVFGHSYYRQASQSAWIKKGTGIGLSVKTVY